MTNEPTTIGFDPSARITLSIDRTLPDDGREHLVEAVMRRRADGDLEFVVEHDDGDEMLVIAVRAGFLFSAAQVSEARRSAAA